MFYITFYMISNFYERLYIYFFVRIFCIIVHKKVFDEFYAKDSYT